MGDGMNVERLVSIVCALVAGIAGYLIGDYRGQIEMQDLQLQAAVLRAEQGREAYEKLVAVQDALEASRADRDRDAREYAERVRQLDADRRRKASAAQCRDERAAVARCESLLKEGVGLLGEGSGLLRRNADLHDAVINLIK